MRSTARKTCGALDPGRGGQRRGFTLIELLVVVVVIGVLVAIALPSYIRIKDKAKEAETKASLHNIQLTLERFSVDSAGEYPQYLIGGEPRFKDEWSTSENSGRMIYGEVPLKQASDPLLRNGYLNSYPKNPFLRHAESVDSVQAQAGDPLRNRWKDGQRMGTRFGADCNIMGQVLCDARYMQWTYINDVTGQPISLDTWANVQYDFYDVWMGNQQKPYLPGSFMYKSMGEIVPSGDRMDEGSAIVIKDGNAINPATTREDEATLPLANTQYILGAWGGFRTKGMDVLGEEPLVVFTYKKRSSRNWADSSGMFVFDPVTGKYQLPGPGLEDVIQLLGIPSWTRGVNRAHVGPLWGSPYGPSLGEEEQLSEGNRNGMQDAIILMLDGGQN